MTRYQWPQGFFTCKGDMAAFAPWVEIAGVKRRCAARRKVEVPTDFTIHNTREEAEAAALLDHNLVVTGQLERSRGRVVLHYDPRYYELKHERRIITP